MEENQVIPVTATDVAKAESPAKPARAPRATKPARKEPVGVVGPLPLGFAELLSALDAVRAGTDMKSDALRKDAGIVVRAMEKAFGKKPAPPAGRGRFTGLRTYDFQNTLYAVNDRPEWRFSDRALAIAWIAELASNKCDFAVKSHYVGSTRTDYTRNRHGSNVIDARHQASQAWPVPTTETK